MKDAEAQSVHCQFFANQLWETIAFLAKAASLVLLTPLMLRAWGSGGYGEFALASSAFVVLSALDCGIRPRLRLALCHALSAADEDEYSAAICRALVSLFAVALLAFALVATLVATPFASAVLRLNPAQSQLILCTTGMTALVLLSGMLVEPLAAHGELGMFKLAHALGATVAIPAVLGCLQLGFGPTAAVVAWLGCLAAANVVLFSVSRLRAERVWTGLRRVRVADVQITLREGFWFGAINLTWLAKTHGLTFVILQISGTAAAGVFFILLRISEVIGTLCAVSSDAAIAALARAKDGTQRARILAAAHRYVALLSLHAALFVVLLMPDMLKMWLGSAINVSVATMCGVAVFGVAGAFNRIVTGGAMGLGLVRLAMAWGVLEALLTFAGAAVAQYFLGFAAAFVVAALAMTSLLPVAAEVAKTLEQSLARTWLQPLQSFIVMFCGVTVVAVIARLSGGAVLLGVSAAGVAASVSWQIFFGGTHKQPSPDGVHVPSLPCAAVFE